MLLFFTSTFPSFTSTFLPVLSRPSASNEITCKPRANREQAARKPASARTLLADSSQSPRRLRGRREEFPGLQRLSY